MYLYPMPTIKIQAPEKYTSFLKDSNEFEALITELMYDYVEKKQDHITQQRLDYNPYFHTLNRAIERRLWK